MPVYLDHNATTPLDPRVREAMLPWLGELHGNASSVHGFGRAAREAVEEARARVAALVGAAPAEIVFVASGTEANNMVLWDRLRSAGHGHLVISALEHPSIAVLAEHLGRLGMEVDRVPPRPDGVVDPAEMLAAVRDDTSLVCLMLANNELGTIQPVAEVARGCRSRGVPMLCDAVQAVGKIPVSCSQLEVDYLTVAAHKFHGPLGAAALWVRPDAEVASLLLGGGQERRRRASTENVPAIVGFGRAAELAGVELDDRRRHLASLRDRFEAGLTGIPDAIVHAASAPRLPHTSHVAFTGLEGEALTIRLDLEGFAVSTGSACASGVVEPSPALLAMGLLPEEALASVRISFGMTNDQADVDRFLAVLEREVAALRGLLVADREGR